MVLIQFVGYFGREQNCIRVVSLKRRTISRFASEKQTVLKVIFYLWIGFPNRKIVCQRSTRFATIVDVWGSKAELGFIGLWDCRIFLPS
jgi:hypothetical protein